MELSVFSLIGLRILRLRELLGPIEQIRKQSDDSSLRTRGNAILFSDRHYFAAPICRIKLWLSQNRYSSSITPFSFQ